jgi:PAS domain S-box-containing protein
VAKLTAPDIAAHAAALLDRIDDLAAGDVAHLLLMSVTDYAIYTIDPAGKIISWNPGAERIKGYAAADIIGEHFSVFYPEEERAAGQPERELLAAIDGRFETDGWRLRKDGTRFWANVVVTPVFGRGGALIGFAKVTRDLTERRTAEEERLRLARAETAVRLRDDFVNEAKRTLDTIAVTIRVHLQSLSAVTSRETGDSAANVSSKVRMLEWGLDRLTQSIDKVLELAAETSESLAKNFDAETRRK